MLGQSRQRRSRQTTTCFACWLADTLAAALLVATCSCSLEISVCRRCAVTCTEAGSVRCLQTGLEWHPGQHINLPQKQKPAGCAPAELRLLMRLLAQACL